ncbi:MAG: S-methyl-5-thioribose-1-phosphate isomerase [Candidatus Bipolaricaulota bacterium]
MIQPVRWVDGTLELLDQTLLPHREQWLQLTKWEEVADAIGRLAVRGAPAIGIAAAYALVLAVQGLQDRKQADRALSQAARGLAAARPTAVNLFWALERLQGVWKAHAREPVEAARSALLAEARRIHTEDVEGNRAMGRHGAELLSKGSSILTICNTGGLATGGYGTALGVVRAAWAQGKLRRAYLCETRPLLQGSRLNAWELLQEGIPFWVLVDGAAGALLASGKVDAVIVGADRIAGNGDTANKIGTYTLGCLADRHGVPFYVVAPLSTIDRHISSGGQIPIEERRHEEVLAPLGQRAAPEGSEAWNPAFDVTPAELITAIISERGVLRPPYERAITAALA